MVKNTPANVGDVGSIPGPGRFRMLEGLSLGATTAEPGYPRVCSATTELTATRRLNTETRK